MIRAWRIVCLVGGAWVFLGAGVLMGDWVFRPAGAPASGTSTELATTMLRERKLPPSTRKSLVVKSMPFVETAPIVVTVKMLDPEHGYRPKVYNGEGGSCETIFKSDFGFDSGPPQVKPGDSDFVATLRCLEPHAKVTVEFNLWLPTYSPWWLTDHEETHRAISERTYAEGIPRLSAILKQMNNKTYEVHAKTEALAYRAVHEAPVKEFNEAYVKLLPREMRLNEEFDRITHHGTLQEKSNRDIIEDIFTEDAKAGGAATTTRGN